MIIASLHTRRDSTWHHCGHGNSVGGINSGNTYNSAAVGSFNQDNRRYDNRRYNNAFNQNQRYNRHTNNQRWNNQSYSHRYSNNQRWSNQRTNNIRTDIRTKFGF